MNFWNRFSHKFFGQRSVSLEAQLELTKSYQRVFLSNPSRADQQIVLADMAAQCGWSQISSPKVTSEELWFREGKRAAFEIIQRHIALSPEDVIALENAVKHEQAARQDINPILT